MKLAALAVGGLSLVGVDALKKSITPSREPIGELVKKIGKLATDEQRQQVISSKTKRARVLDKKVATPDPCEELSPYSVINTTYIIEHYAKYDNVTLSEDEALDLIEQADSAVTSLNEETKLCSEKKKNDITEKDQITMNSIGGNPGHCPDGWYSYEDRCYKVDSQEQTWQECKETCSNMESSMLCIEDYSKNQFIRGINSQISPFQNVWVGLNDIDNENDWVWDNGCSSYYRHWAWWEPNNANDGEDCAEIGSDGYWNDNECSSKRHCGCERTVASYEVDDDWYLGATEQCKWLIVHSSDKCDDTPMNVVEGFLGGYCEDKQAYGEENYMQWNFWLNPADPDWIVVEGIGHDDSQCLDSANGDWQLYVLPARDKCGYYDDNNIDLFNHYGSGSYVECNNNDDPFTAYEDGDGGLYTAYFSKLSECASNAAPGVVGFRREVGCVWNNGLHDSTDGRLAYAKWGRDSVETFASEDELCLKSLSLFDDTTGIPSEFLSPLPYSSSPLFEQCDESVGDDDRAQDGWEPGKFGAYAHYSWTPRGQCMVYKEEDFSTLAIRNGKSKWLADVDDSVSTCRDVDPAHFKDLSMKSILYNHNTIRLTLQHINYERPLDLSRRYLALSIHASDGQNVYESQNLFVQPNDILTDIQPYVSGAKTFKVSLDIKDSLFKNKPALPAIELRPPVPPPAPFQCADAVIHQVSDWSIGWGNANLRLHNTNTGEWFYFGFYDDYSYERTVSYCLPPGAYETYNCGGYWSESIHWSISIADEQVSSGSSSNGYWGQRCGMYCWDWYNYSPSYCCYNTYITQCGHYQSFTIQEVSYPPTNSPTHSPTALSTEPESYTARVEVGRLKQGEREVQDCINVNF